MNSQSVQHPNLIWVESIDPDLNLSLGVTDAIGKYFHPNKLSDETITAWAIQTLIDTRAEVLGLGGPSRATENRSNAGRITAAKATPTRRGSARTTKIPATM